MLENFSFTAGWGYMIRDGKVAELVKDVVLVGSSFKEGMTVVTHNNTKGLVRAFDVKSGKLLWTFNTIPRPGEFGNDTWEKESWAQNGNTGVWTQITVDEELGLVYLPVESPTSDFYGGHRPGDLVAWQQLVHESLARIVDEERARTAQGLRDQERFRTIEDRRVELHKLDVGDTRTSASGFEDSLAIADAAVGGAPIKSRVTAGREHGASREDGQAAGEDSPGT